MAPTFYYRSGCTSIALLDLKAEDLDVAVKDLTACSAGEPFDFLVRPEKRVHSLPDVIRCRMVDTALEAEVPVKAIGIVCDVTSETDIVAAMDKIVETFGRIDVAVASAGRWAVHTGAVVGFRRPTGRTSA